MVNEVEELAIKYNNLIKKDKKYWEDYEKKDKADKIKKIFYDLFFKTLKWKDNKIDIAELERMISSNSKELYELLRIEDYYSDSLCDLECEYFNMQGDSLSEEDIDKFFQNVTLDDILKDAKASQQIKDCIQLYRDASKVCEEINNYKKSQKGDKDFQIGDIKNK